MPVRWTPLRKLVRDLIPNIIRQNGDEPFIRTLSLDAEFLTRLHYKLIEEGDELISASLGMSKAGIVSEAADVIEVLRAMMKTHHIPFRLVEKARLEKLRKKGGFKNRTLLTKVKQNSSTK